MGPLTISNYCRPRKTTSTTGRGGGACFITCPSPSSSLSSSSSSSCLCRVGKVTRLRATGRDNEEEQTEEFVRSETQQKIKNADDAVKNAQAEVGKALTGALESSGLAKVLGIGGGTKKGSKPSSGGGLDLPSGAGKGKVDSGRSGQSKKWIDAREVLLSAGVTSIGGEEARSLLKREGGKAVILDVRPLADYEAFHAKGSKSAQFYRYPDSSDLFSLSVVRQIAYAAQGVQAVEKNKNFVPDAEASAGEAKTVIVACGSGGTMTQTNNFPLGQASRSLLAAAELIQAGWTDKKIFHLKGGLNNWFKEGGDGEGEKEEWSDTSGRVPFVPGYSVEQDAEELK